MKKLWSYQRLKYCNTIERLYLSTSCNLKLLKESSKNVDIIGPPDKISNLRPIIFTISEKETDLEKKYRLAREITQEWNQKFWTEHNAKFIQERKQFQHELEAQGKSLTADEMSVFYKSFLDKNWNCHLDYNILWYKQNIRLLLLEFRVRLSKLKFT